jgi:hypothetical protein
MWKAKIKRFFIYEFYGDRKVFFEGDFYNITTLTSSFALAFKHDTTSMVVLQSHLQRWPRTNVIPSNFLMHKFIPMPIVGKNNELIIAYELEDISPRVHIFQQRMFGVK